MIKILLLVAVSLLLLRSIRKRIRRLFNIYIRKDEFTIEVSRWFSDNGDETLRLDYPALSGESIVFDLGGYVGDFAYKINKKYGCKVYLFEPHPMFSPNVWKGFPRIKILYP